MRSKMVIDEINDMKMKLGSNVTLRKTGKTKVDSNPPKKASTQLNESESKISMIIGKAMTDCLTHPER